MILSSKLPFAVQGEPEQPAMPARAFFLFPHLEIQRD